MTHRSTALIAVLLLAGSVVADATAQPRGGRRAKADQAVSDGLKSGKRMRVIVKTRAGAEAALKARAGQRGTLGRSHDALNAFAAELESRDVEQLLQDPRVVGVSADDVVRKQDNDAPSENPYAHRNNYDTQALRKTLGLVATDVGRSVGVAVIDTGIAPTDDVKDRITAFYDFTRNGAAVRTLPNDPNGHGTHVAGLIAGNGAGSKGKYVGIAPAVRLIGLKVLDEKGEGYTSDVIAALEFAVARKASLGIDVVNL